MHMHAGLGNWCREIACMYETFIGMCMSIVIDCATKRYLIMAFILVILFIIISRQLKISVCHLAITWLYLYRTLSVLDSTCTGLYLYWTLPVQDSICTGLYLYRTLSVLDSTCTGLYLYWTLPVLDSICTGLYLYRTLSVSICTGL